MNRGVTTLRNDFCDFRKKPDDRKSEKYMCSE
jgi:hypothetical protein